MSNSKILLISPQIDYAKMFGKASTTTPSMIPLNLLYLSGYLESKNIPVKVLDGQVNDLSEESLIRHIKQFNPNIVGISCHTPLVYPAHTIAKIVKSVSRQITVIMGGPHPTVLPEQIIADENVDTVVRGEGEITLFELVEAIKGGTNLNSILGITYRDNGNIVSTQNRPLNTDLDSLPLPSRHLIPIREYHPQADIYYRFPSTIMITSRGCPYKCIFCASRQISGHKYRVRSPEKVVEEIDVLVNQYGIRNIGIADDNFVVDRKRTERICDILIKEGYHRKVDWSCALRADGVDEPLLKKMRAAGCRCICVGIETGSQRLMNILKKHLKLERVEKGVRMMRKVGIKVRGTFLLGIPTETEEETLQTINFAKKLNLDFAKFNIITPYPGTELYEMAKERGLVGDDTWVRLIPGIGFSDAEPVFVPEGRGPKELKAKQQRAARIFYLRPWPIWNLANNIRSFDDFKRYFYAAKLLLKL